MNVPGRAAVGSGIDWDMVEGGTGPGPDIRVGLVQVVADRSPAVREPDIRVPVRVAAEDIRVAASVRSPVPADRDRLGDRRVGEWSVPGPGS